MELQVISENSRRPPSFWMGFPSWNTEAMTLPGSLFLMVKNPYGKAVGRLRVLDEKINHGTLLPGFCGIGHTRWATHGCPSDTNAHPHMNEEHTIAVVHNGIIENYEKLKQRLEKKGYRFVSETDTEVLAHMLTEYYRGDPVEAIEKVMHRVEGSYALGIMFLDHPHHIYAARKDSPLIVGINDTGKFIASDVPAILQYTRTVYYVEMKKSSAFPMSTLASAILTASLLKNSPSPSTGISTLPKKVATNTLCSRKSTSSQRLSVTRFFPAFTRMKSIWAKSV